MAKIRLTDNSIKKERPYQKEIIQNLIVFTRDNHGQHSLVMLPTGSGKTFIAKRVAQMLGRVMFLVPRKSLLDQAIEEFHSLRPEIIMGNKQVDSKKKIFLSTIQTMTSSGRASLIEELEISVIMIDEVHFGHNGTMRALINSFFKGSLIGLSATPFDYDGKLLTGYHNIIDKYDTKFMVDNKWLCNVETLCPMKVDLKGVRTTNGDYNIQDLDFKMNTPLMIKTVVEVSSKLIQGRNRILVYCVSIAHANAMGKAFAKTTKRKIKILHSKTPVDERDDTITKFATGKIDMLISVDMLTTGFNVPEADTVIVARPTKSQNLYKQIIGRVMRPHPSKSFGLFIDCGNLVANLGMPLDPITERIKGEDEDREFLCTNCGSEKEQIRVVKDKAIFYICPDCNNEVAGERKQKHKKVYTCPHCKLVNPPEHTQGYFEYSKYGVFFPCKSCKKIVIAEHYHVKYDEHLFIKLDIDLMIVYNIVEKLNLYYENIFKEYAIPVVARNNKAYLKTLITSDKNELMGYVNKIRRIIEKEDEYGEYSIKIKITSIEKHRENFMRTRAFGLQMQIDEVRDELKALETRFYTHLKRDMSGDDYYKYADYRIYPNLNELYTMAKKQISLETGLLGNLFGDY